MWLIRGIVKELEGDAREAWLVRKIAGWVVERTERVETAWRYIMETDHGRLDISGKRPLGRSRAVLTMASCPTLAILYKEFTTLHYLLSMLSPARHARTLSLPHINSEDEGPDIWRLN